MKKNVIFAAGGTGGHIYPALAIAESLVQQDSSYNILFVGTSHGLENTIVPNKGYKLLHLPVGRLNHNVSKAERILTLLQLPLAFLVAAFYCIKYRPKFLLGVGGHASGPMLLVASLLGFKTILWEPNAMPGLANRILSKFCTWAWVVFEGARKRMGAKARPAGYPLRAAIEKVSGKAGQFSPNEFSIFVYGGSRGALGINLAILDWVKHYPHMLDKVKLCHQVGTVNFEENKAAYSDLGVWEHKNLEVLAYVDDMEAKYQWADLMICRAGAGTVTEVCAVGGAAVFIPLPTASDDHQRKNAEELVAKGAGVLLLQKDASPEKLQRIIEQYIENSEKLNQMKRAAHKFYVPNAANDMAATLIQELGS